MNICLGPGLLNNIFDGIGRPLKTIEQQSGAFIPRGVNVPQLDPERLWKTVVTVSPVSYTHLMLVDISHAPIPFSELKDKLTNTGTDMGLRILVMHEDIFNSMHKI